MQVKHSRKAALLAVLASFSLFGASPSITRINRVDFFGKTSPNQIVINADAPIQFEKIENTKDHQVIIEIKNARLANRNAARRLDTSSFDSKVSLISPYQVEGQDTVRVIVQLRGDTTTPVVADGSRLLVGIGADPDPAAFGSSYSSTTTKLADNEAPPSDPNAPPMPDTSAFDKQAEPSKSSEGRMDQFLDAQKTKQYIGKHVTLQFKEADVQDVFRLVGETSGFNIVFGNDVMGKISLSLVDVPWDLALDTILSTLKLGAERNGNVLRVATLAQLTSEKQQQLQAKQAALANAPRVTRIFPISYAKPTALVPILQKFGAGNAGSLTQTSNPDTISVDERTNSLIIQDVQENIDRMSKIIALLDKPTPQVQIEAKIIEGSEQFSNSISGSLGVGALNLGQSGWVVGNGGLLSNPDPSTGGSNAVSNGTAGTDFTSGFGGSLKISALANLRLNALLQLNETQSKTKLVSAPKLVVLNKQQASIIQGTPVLVPTTSIVNNVPVVTDSVQIANLSLNVTPTVTNDGSIVMDVNVSADNAQSVSKTQNGIATRSIKTTVVNESGSTLVVGGIYKATQQHLESGFPGLRQIPLLGKLFGSDSSQNDRSELFIFITPRVLNEKESGGAG